MVSIWNWISLASFLTLLVLYTILLLIGIHNAYRWKIERLFRRRLRNILKTFHSTTLENVLIHIDIVYRQSRNLQKWHPDLIGLLEHTFNYVILPSTLLKSQSWQEGEIIQYTEVMNAERVSYRYPKLRPEIEGHFNVIRSLLEGCEPGGWEEALMNFARSTQMIDQKEERRQLWNRISVILTIITSILTIVFFGLGMFN